MMQVCCLQSENSSKKVESELVLCELVHCGLISLPRNNLSVRTQNKMQMQSDRFWLSIHI